MAEPVHANDGGPVIGEISDAARRKADEKAKSLRALKYRLLFIFLLLPSLLVAAIVVDWIAESELLAHLSRTYVTFVYAGMIAAFVIVFLIIGWVIRKRLRHEEEQAQIAAKPIDGIPTKPPMPKSGPKSARNRSRN